MPRFTTNRMVEKWRGKKRIAKSEKRWAFLTLFAFRNNLIMKGNRMSISKMCFIILLLTIIAISGCIPGDGACTQDNPAGFFSGIWHGWIAPVSLIIGFFKPSIRVYETFNTGWWYDFGFYIAIIGGFGSFSLLRKKKNKEN